MLLIQQKMEMSNVEGRNPVIEALKNKGTQKIIIQRNLKKNDKIETILKLAKLKKIPVEYAPKEWLDRESKTSRHQGVIAIIDMPTYYKLENVLSKSKKEICLLLLDRIQDPQNLGSILRTSESAEVDGVVIPPRDSVDLTPTVRRVAMGGDRIPIIKESLFRAIKMIRDEGISVIGVDPSGEKTIYQENLRGAMAFLIGGEHHGLSKEILGKCDSVVKIPMHGSISSLNVGVATALVLFERLRQMND